MNTKVYKEINVDFSDMKYLLIRAKQNDSGSRFLLINCYNSGNRVLLNGQNHKAFIRYVKADGYGVFNTGKITNDGSIEIELTEQMLAVAGNSVADVVLIDNSDDGSIELTVNEEGQLVLPSDSKIISTMNFAIEVIQSPLDSSEIESTYEFNALNDLLKRANLDYSNIIKALKEYRDKALESKESAKISETNAKESEINSKASENKTKESETNAKLSENKSRQSEENARLSEANSKTSETNSKESEKKAKQSEINAKTSERNIAQIELESILNAKKAQSYAVGGTDFRPDENVKNARHYYEQVKQISESLGGALLPMGTILFSELQNQTKSKGYMYNISDDFISDDTFKDGGGIPYPSGTNVYWSVDNKWDCLAKTDVTGVKGDKEVFYRKGNVNITPENIGVYDKEVIDIKFTEFDTKLNSTNEHIVENFTRNIQQCQQQVNQLNENLSNNISDLSQSVDNKFDISNKRTDAIIKPIQQKIELVENQIRNLETSSDINDRMVRLENLFLSFKIKIKNYLNGVIKDVDENNFELTFQTLKGINLKKGNFNKVKHRIEC